jgi:hypothetical protein
VDEELHKLGYAKGEFGKHLKSSFQRDIAEARGKEIQDWPQGVCDAARDWMKQERQYWIEQKQADGSDGAPFDGEQQQQVA